MNQPGEDVAETNLKSKRSKHDPVEIGPKSKRSKLNHAESSKSSSKSKNTKKLKEIPAEEVKFKECVDMFIQNHEVYFRSVPDSIIEMDSLDFEEKKLNWIKAREKLQESALLLPSVSLMKTKTSSGKIKYNGSEVLSVLQKQVILQATASAQKLVDTSRTSWKTETDSKKKKLLSQDCKKLETLLKDATDTQSCFNIRSKNEEKKCKDIISKAHPSATRAIGTIRSNMRVELVELKMDDWIRNRIIEHRKVVNIGCQNANISLRTILKVY